MGPLVKSNMIYSLLELDLEKISPTCQLLMKSPPAWLVIVRSITELWPQDLRNAGVEPLLAQDCPNDERKSMSSLPRSLHILFPQSVWWELLSDPTMRRSLVSMANLARGVVSWDGAVKIHVRGWKDYKDQLIWSYDKYYTFTCSLLRLSGAELDFN
jgi:hypothetical protein